MVKNPPANAGNAGDMDSIPGSGRFLGGGNDHPFQYSCLGNPMDRGAWWATVHRDCTESDITEQLSAHTLKLDMGSRRYFIALKAPELDWSIERPADLKLTLKQRSNRGNYTTLGREEDDVRSRQLAQDADLTCVIIYNVFLIPWTYAYQSRIFYYGHDSMLV